MSTARKGTRTGVPELRTQDVNRVAKKIFSLLSKICPSGKVAYDFGNGTEDKFVDYMTVRDAATGASRKVPVYVSTSSKFVRRFSRATGVLVEEEIHVLPPHRCAPSDEALSQITTTLKHEATHAVDPGLRIQGVLKKPQKVGSCEYYNEPGEMAAYLQEVRHEISQMRCQPDPDSALYTSNVATKLRACLTPKNWRRVQKVVARAWETKCSRNDSTSRGRKTGTH